MRSRTKTRCILVVEDAPRIREFIATYLRRHGYDVEMAIKGADALARIESRIPDLVISDFLMPEMHRVDLVKAIRGEPSLQHLSILLMVNHPVGPRHRPIEGACIVGPIGAS